MAGEDDRPQPHATMTPKELGATVEGPGALDEAVEPAGAGAADLAGAERPAEGFGSSPGGPPSDEPPYAPTPSRSVMPTVLSVIGVLVILLLGTTLYKLYNPPADPEIAALRADVEAQKHEVEALKQQVAALPKVDLAPLDGRLAGLAADVTQLKSAVASDAGVKDAIAPIDSRVTGLATRVDDLQGTLAKEVEDLKGAVAAIPKTDLGPLTTQVGDVAKRLDPVDAKVAEIDKRLVPLETYFNAPKVDVAVTAARQNGSAAETRAAPVAVIAQGIEQAIPAGRPFQTEATALGTLGVEPALLQTLDAVAVKGAATDAALLSEFNAVQDGIVVAAAPVKTGTMFDRMMANAQSLVDVTKTGAATGGDAGSVASRIAADLRRGALSDAAAEWDRLPEASKAPSAAWAVRLKARIAAEETAHAIAAKAVAALAAAQ